MTALRRLALGVAAVLGLAAATPAAYPAGYELQGLYLDHGIARVFSDRKWGVLVEDRRGGIFRVLGWPLMVLPLSAARYVPPAPAIEPDLVPGARIARGHRNIRSAWLARPTERYRHGVFGSAVEAGALIAVDAVGTAHTLVLEADAVFEDREARIVDVDGDRRDEIVVVKAYADRGAALAIYRLDRDGLVLAAETPPIGRPQRWLNPIGVADLDGDGKPELAVVETPHIGGVVVIYRYERGVLRELARRPGYSNHAMGALHQGLAAIADLDGDGVADLVVPTANRRALEVLSFKGGEFRTLYRTEYTLGEVVTDVIAADIDRDDRLDLAFGLSNRAVMVVFNRIAAE